MEHRYTERKLLRLGVVVTCPHLGLIRGRSRDVGLGGMFVQTDCVVMPLNAPVNVSFQPDAQRPLVCFEAQGMVIHQHAGGFGLMFDELQPACRDALRALLYAPGTAGSCPERAAEAGA